MRTIVVLVLLVAAGVVVARPGVRSTAASRPGSAGRLIAAADPVAHAKRIPTRSADVFARPALARYLRSRPDIVTAAVIDTRTAHAFVYRPWGRAITASIVKVDILETLLGEAQDADRDLTEDERELSSRMIEDSDNDAAEDLWELVGGAPALVRYNARAGLTETRPDAAAWGLTTTSALDQVRLVQHVCYPNDVLQSSSRRYALELMSHVEPSQAWGVSGGVPRGAVVALKNGWLPYDGGWHVNSVGCVRGAGRDYVIAVLADGGTTEGSAIDEIEGLSRLVWARLASSTSREHGRRTFTQ